MIFFCLKPKEFVLERRIIYYFYEDSIAHKDNLMISSSVGSGYPSRYWYETPHEYYHSDGTSREK